VSEPGPGIVYLVGAGPGDPGLLTVRGATLLEAADVVVYDYLSNPLLLDRCRTDAERHYVGKKAARHSMSQEQINALLVENGRAGRRVVRLKGGDPFVFGRGGEECEALAAAGVPFEVVPGITAAIAAPAYAGIPVTHRDFNSSFTFITGHEKEEEYKDADSRGREPAPGSSDLDWPSIAKLPCLAFYMGVKSLPRICAKLIEHGMSPDTPAATIRWGTTPQQRTVVGTLKDLPTQVGEAELKPPALTIVGRVVSLRETLNWFERRPLFGQTIAVTRTRQQASELSQRLAERGARVIEAPTIDVVPPENWQDVDVALKHLWLYSIAAAEGQDPRPIAQWLMGERYRIVVFTSANGVTATRGRLDALGFDARAFGGTTVAVVGEATATACRDHLRITPDVVPDRHTSDGLADALAALDTVPVRGARVLLLRADIARLELVDRLRALGATVDDLEVYRTRPASELPDELLAALDARELTWVTFTSSSTARNLANLLGPDYRSRLQGIKLASIGPVTTATLRELGLEPTVQAETSNVDSLVAAMEAATSARRPPQV
jgi:uroporphyrinogen III methyltransferase / synthase